MYISGEDHSHRGENSKNNLHLHMSACHIKCLHVACLILMVAILNVLFLYELNFICVDIYEPVYKLPTISWP